VLTDGWHAQRTREEEASDLSSSASARPAKKSRPDAAGKTERAADDSDLVAEGRGRRAAAKSAAGGCAACVLGPRPHSLALRHL